MVRMHESGSADQRTGASGSARSRVRLVAVIAVVASASVLMPTATWARSSATVIEVISLTTSLHAHRATPKRASPGDWIAETDRLINLIAQFGKRRGAIVGNDRATFTNHGSGVLTVDGAATFPGGTILFRGRVTTRKDGTEVLPVAGGTGHFAGARGTLTIGQIRSDERVALNIYRLTLPPAI